MIDKSGNYNMQAAARIWETKRKFIFAAFSAVFVMAFFRDLRDLFAMSYNSGEYAYIPFIPFISAYLMYQDRSAIFQHPRRGSLAGLFIIACGMLFVIAAHRYELDHNDTLSCATFGLVLVWIGIFTLCQGTRSLRSAAFPLLFLVFAVPLPEALNQAFVGFLQSGSTMAAQAIFKVLGVPVERDGFLFIFPNLTIQVAPECSGIHSALALMISGSLAAKLFLSRGWSRAVVACLIIPIAMFKNGFRIATLSLLASYWDARILDSPLHHKGGAVFFILALALLGGAIVVLKRYEKHRPDQPDLTR